jgi:hypothetical protein
VLHVLFYDGFRKASSTQRNVFCFRHIAREFFDMKTAFTEDVFSPRLNSNH